MPQAKTGANNGVMRVSWITSAMPRRDRDGKLTAEMASLRYRVLAPIAGMDNAGLQHRIFPTHAETDADTIRRALDADVMVFCKAFIPRHEQLLRMAAAQGVKTIFDICDNLYPHPTIGPVCAAMSNVADLVVCNTPQMAQIASGYSRRGAEVIDDPFEGPRGAPRTAAKIKKLLWFGHRSNLSSVEHCLDELAQHSKTHPLELTLLTKEDQDFRSVVDKANARYAPTLSLQLKPWSLEDQWSELAACDAVIVPGILNERTKTKSANRTVEALWAGRPVVAQPMPAVDKYAAWTPISPSIAAGLAELEARPAFYAERLREAQDYIERHNSPQVIAAQWKTLIIG